MIKGSTIWIEMIEAQLRFGVQLCISFIQLSTSMLKVAPRGEVQIHSGWVDAGRRSGF